MSDCLWAVYGSPPRGRLLQRAHSLAAWLIQQTLSERKKKMSFCGIFFLCSVPAASKFSLFCSNCSIFWRPATPLSGAVAVQIAESQNCALTKGKSHSAYCFSQVFSRSSFIPRSILFYFLL